MTTMAESETEYSPEELRGRRFLSEMLQGVAIAFGLGLLWIMETARDAWFALLDRFNVKPRARRASAFPPGRPRRAVKRARQ